MEIWNVIIAENPRVEAVEAGVATGRGQVAEGEHRPAVRRRLRLPAQLPRRRRVRRLRALCKDEGQAHHGRQGGRRQDRARRGAVEGAQGVHADDYWGGDQDVMRWSKVVTIVSAKKEQKNGQMNC